MPVGRNRSRARSRRYPREQIRLRPARSVIASRPPPLANWRAGDSAIPWTTCTAPAGANRTRAGDARRKVEPIYRWDDIVLPGEALAQLREMRPREPAASRPSDWFSGSSLGRDQRARRSERHGQTMAAEIIANELYLDLTGSISRTSSANISAKRKESGRASPPRRARRDSLFRRSGRAFRQTLEVRDSFHYANARFPTCCKDGRLRRHLLATKTSAKPRRIVLRRLAFTIHFPFPDEAERLRIWNAITARRNTAAPTSISLLAHQFKLSGGNIRRRLAAAYLAANNEEQHYITFFVGVEDGRSAARILTAGLSTVRGRWCTPHPVSTQF